MVDSKNTDGNKKEPLFPIRENGKQEPIAATSAEDEFSSEDIDLLLAEEDPEFSRQINLIGEDKDLSFSQIEISKAEEALNEERSRWEKSSKVFRVIYRVFPVVARISLLLKKIKFLLFSIWQSIFVRAKNFLYYLATDGRTAVLKSIGGAFKKIFSSINQFNRYFRYLPWPTKLFFFGTLALIGFTGIFIYRSMTTGVINVSDDLFLPSFEKVADFGETYDPEKEVEPFYENLRVSTNILLITQMVVNLKPSVNSTKNPMAALEFYVEGSTPEAIVEVKDREVEIRDRMQRTLEDMTFDQVDSTQGKELMLTRLQKEINSLLTTGKIKRVFIKTAVVKP